MKTTYSKPHLRLRFVLGLLSIFIILLYTTFHISSSPEPLSNQHAELEQKPLEHQIPTELLRWPTEPDRNPSKLDVTERGSGSDDSIPGWLTQESNPTTANIKNAMSVEGRNMVCYMDAPAGSQQWPQSTYTGTNDIRTYGWTYSAVPATREDINQMGLTSAFDTLLISTDLQKWIKLELQHMGNAQWPATYAIFSNFINFNDGVLVAAQNYGPKWQIQKHGLGIADDKITPLNKWSDLMFLGMQKYIDDNDLDQEKLKIRHVFRAHLQNEDVLKRILLVTEGTDKDDPAAVGVWPGLTYPINSHQGLATLSIANGKSVGFLLAQHKGQMGIRGTDLVRIFDCQLEGENGDKADRWCMYFHVKDGSVGSFG